MNDVHHCPFAALGGVHGAQDQVVLVQERWTGQVARRSRRIERHLAQEPAAGGVGSSHLLQLLDVLDAGLWTAVAVLDDRLAEAADASDLGRRRQRASVGQAVGQRLAQAIERFLGRLGHVRRRVHQLLEWSAVGNADADGIHDRAGTGWPDPVEQLEDAEPADLVEGVLQDPEQRQRVLDVRGLHELEAAVLDEGDVAAGQLQLEHVAVVAGTEEDRLLAEGSALLAVLEDLLADLY